MAKRYTRVNFQNRPSVATPVNNINLNTMDKGIDDLDNAIEEIYDTELPAKAPNNHASESSIYGLATMTNYGHAKTINSLTQASHADGTALSAYQGYVLNQNKVNTADKATTDTENNTNKWLAANVGYTLGQEIDTLKNSYDNHNLGYHARIFLTSGTIFNTIADKISQGYVGGDIILVAYAPSDTYNTLPFGLIKWSLVWSDIATLQFITARVNNLVTRSISPSESFDTGWVLH